MYGCIWQFLSFENLFMKQNHPLDAIDLRLLELLQGDASLSNQALSVAAHLSPATCHRRVKRMQDEGWIERQVAILSADKLRHFLGYGLTALVEVTLEVQTELAMEQFESHAVLDTVVQQCWRVSPGPDFVLVMEVGDMDGYQAAARRLFTAELGVRNVRSFFSVKRAKFGSEIKLPSATPRQR